MPAKKIKAKNDELNAMTMAAIFADEDKAREFLEAKRWPNGPVCPHCGSEKAYRFTPKPDSKSPARPGVCKCAKCRKQFTVRVGTIFEDSKLPIRFWLYAIHLMTSSKKGVSSHQIARELGITVKSAWFVTHRIREAMKLEPMAGMLKGQVEADECYVGGRPRYGAPKTQGRRDAKKPVVVLVERDGKAYSAPMRDVTEITMRRELQKVVDANAAIFTDQNMVYHSVGQHFAQHHTVNHHAKEYARQEDGFVAHSNTAESFFAILKRGHYGTFHQLSEKHLHRYCTEFAFRWNHRHVSDGQRMLEAIKGVKGKRLVYRAPVSKAEKQEKSE